MTPFAVSLAACKDYTTDRLDYALQELLQPLGGLKAFVQPGMKILLKPNLILPRPVEAAVCTDPALVLAVARLVIRLGARPIIADSPAFSSAQAVARSLGLLEQAYAMGVEVRDLAAKPRVHRLGAGSPIPRVALGGLLDAVDGVINLPKIKTHCQMGMSLGTKNLYGAIAGKRKALLHFRNGEDPLRFGRLVVAVCREVAPMLTIADGIISLERNGPTEGDPRDTGFLAAGVHPVAVDRAVLEILGVAPTAVPYLDAAKAMQYGPADLHGVAIYGVDPAALQVENYVTVSEPYKAINFSLKQVCRSVLKQAGFLLKARLATRSS